MRLEKEMHYSISFIMKITQSVSIYLFLLYFIHKHVYILDRLYIGLMNLDIQLCVIRILIVCLYVVQDIITFKNPFISAYRGNLRSAQRKKKT